MNRKHFNFFSLGILLILFAIPTLKIPDCVSAFQTDDVLKVLVITGGHDFNRDAFFSMFDEFPGITYTEVKHPDANDSYRPEVSSNYDVFVFYDMYDSISEPQKEEFLNLLSRGKGMVFLHHSLVSYQDWDEFLQIVGGKYHTDKDTINGNIVGPSTYQHNVEFSVDLVKPNHPVTRGLSDFIIHDEVYGNYTVLPGVEPLLHTDHPQSEEFIGWTNEYRNSRIVYIQPGHDEYAYGNPNFRKIVQQSIEWAAESPIN